MTPSLIVYLLRPSELTSPNTRILHPNRHSFAFASVPEIKSRGLSFPKGNIYLTFGRRKFGAVHIYDKHRREMLQRGFDGFKQVNQFVASIIKPYAPLHFEGGDRANKLAVVQSSSGTAIIQLRNSEDEYYYTVVTAYLGRNPHGGRVGSLQPPI